MGLSFGAVLFFVYLPYLTRQKKIAQTYVWAISLYAIAKLQCVNVQCE